MATEAEHRLPRNVIPVHYDLVLEPDLASATFTGSVDVDVEVGEPTTAIVLNGAELEVAAVTLTSPETGDRIDATSDLDEERQRITVHLGREADPGKWRLHLDFTGVLNDQLRGFYRSDLPDDAGSESRAGHHAVRGHGGAPCLSVLGRTRS